MNPVSHALCQKSSIPTIRRRKPSETPRAWLHRSRPQAREAAPTWIRPHLLWLLFIFLFSCVLWSGKELGTSTVKPPQWQASPVPGPSKPISVSQADRNCNLNELKTLNLSDRAFAKSKDMQLKVTEREDILLKTERMGQRLPPQQPPASLPDAHSRDLQVFAHS